MYVSIHTHVHVCVCVCDAVHHFLTYSFNPTSRKQVLLICWLFILLYCHWPIDYHHSMLTSTAMVFSAWPVQRQDMEVALGEAKRAKAMPGPLENKRKDTPLLVMFPWYSHEFHLTHRVTLCQFDIAIEHGHLVRWFTHSTWWVSIVMLVYGRVDVTGP